MDVWKTELAKLIQLALGNPDSTVELGTVIVLALVTSVVVLTHMGKVAKGAMAETTRSVVIIVTAVLLTLVVTAALNLYVIPRVNGASLRLTISIGSIAVVLLAIVTPLCMFLHRVKKYFSALSSLLLSIAAAVVVVLLVSAGFDAVREGGKGFEKTKERRDGVEESM